MMVAVFFAALVVATVVLVHSTERMDRQAKAERDVRRARVLAELDRHFEARDEHGFWR